MGKLYRINDRCSYGWRPDGSKPATDQEWEDIVLNDLTHAVAKALGVGVENW